MFRRQNLHKAGRSISSPWIVRRRSVIQARIVVQLLVSIQDQLLLPIASKFRFSMKVPYQMTADTWYMCNCLSKAVALFYAPRQRSQFGQKQINRKECNAFSAGNRSASVEFISAGHTTDCYQFPRLGCFASFEFISAERTIESYKLLPIGLNPKGNHVAQ